MHNPKLIRSLTLSAVLAVSLSSSIAIAGSDKQSGKRRGPPPQAIEACADQEEGAACSFSGRRGDVSGSCIVPPHKQDMIVCAPEGGPPKEHQEK